MSEYLTRLAAARGLETKAFVSRATVADLRKDAASRGIAGRSRMGKRELARAVKADPAVAAARKEAAALIREAQPLLRKVQRGAYQTVAEQARDMVPVKRRLRKLLDQSSLDPATRAQMEKTFAALNAEPVIPSAVQSRALRDSQSLSKRARAGVETLRANSRVTRTARKPAGKEARQGGATSISRDIPTRLEAERRAKRDNRPYIGPVLQADDSVVVAHVGVRGGFKKVDSPAAIPALQKRASARQAALLKQARETADNLQARADKLAQRYGYKNTMDAMAAEYKDKVTLPRDLVVAIQKQTKARHVFFGMRDGSRGVLGGRGL